MRYLDELILNDNICVTAVAIGFNKIGINYEDNHVAKKHAQIHMALELLLNLNFYLKNIQNVNTRRCLSELPSFLSPIFERISSCPTFKNVDSDSIVLEQLKVVFPRKEMVCPRAGS
ncbi:uncharacterized protein LOC131611924 [Vicia villosa]|uniref:uncharacterized protein LOC131611924 n=1 Tax=Vicia villosa TaxID=3911 RepID=UPI00273AF7C8|nr:uncharacterized protein LOC131611924 [Vicia villosa]